MLDMNIQVNFKPEELDKVKKAVVEQVAQELWEKEIKSRVVGLISEQLAFIYESLPGEMSNNLKVEIRLRK